MERIRKLGSTGRAQQRQRWIGVLIPPSCLFVLSFLMESAVAVQSGEREGQACH